MPFPDLAFGHGLYEKMEYKEFAQEVFALVQERFSDRKVERHSFLKNNGIEHDALVLVDENRKIELNPTCYIDDFWTEYREGKSMKMIAADICRYLEGSVNKITFSFDELENFEKMKSRIAYKVIRTKSNGKLLRGIPHVDYLDLSLIFYCILDVCEEGTATTMVTNRIQSIWGVTTEELLEYAQKNTPGLLPCRVRDMDDVIREIFMQEMISNIQIHSRFREDEEDVDLDHLADLMVEDFEKTENRVHMYVMTNENRINGAVCMFYKGFLRRIAKKLDCDFIILPSSIHEVILLPERHGIVSEEYNELVREINEKAVDPGEILSDHVYYYRRKEDAITM